MRYNKNSFSLYGKEGGGFSGDRTDAPDGELVSAFVAGSDDAFEILMRRYERRIYSFALSYVKNPQDAQDMCQEVFLRVYKYAGSYSARSSFSTWIHTIAKNLCVTFLEKEKARRGMIYESAENSDGEERDPAENVTDGESAEDVFLKRDLVSAVRREAEKLPEEFRSVIVLREINGLSYEEIAEVLGLNIGTVKSRISRARAMLSKALSDFL